MENFNKFQITMTDDRRPISEDQRLDSIIFSSFISSFQTKNIMATDVIKETNRSFASSYLIVFVIGNHWIMSSESTKIIETDLYSLDLLDIRYTIDLKCFENREESKRWLLNTHRNIPCDQIWWWLRCIMQQCTAFVFCSFSFFFSIVFFINSRFNELLMHHSVFSVHIVYFGIEFIEF